MKIQDNSKQCFFTQHNVKLIDYKDTEILKKFVNPHGRMMSRRRTGTISKYQRQLSDAIKRARYMGLLPYVVR